MTSILRSKIKNIFGENDYTTIKFEELSHSEMGTKKTPKPKELKGGKFSFTIKGKFLAWQVFTPPDTEDVYIRAKGFYEKRNDLYCEWGSELGIDPDATAWIKVSGMNHERDRRNFYLVTNAFARDFPLEDEGLPIVRSIEFALEGLLKGISVRKAILKRLESFNPHGDGNTLSEGINAIKELLRVDSDQVIRYLKNETDYYDIVKELLLIEDIKI